MATAAGPSQEASMQGYLSKKTKGKWFGGPSWKRGFWVISKVTQSIEEYQTEKLDHFVSDLDPRDIYQVKKQDKDKLVVQFMNGNELWLQTSDEYSRNAWISSIIEVVASHQQNEKDAESKSDGGSSKEDDTSLATSAKNLGKKLVKKMSIISMTDRARSTPNSESRKKAANDSLARPKSTQRQQPQQQQPPTPTNTSSSSSSTTTTNPRTLPPPIDTRPNTEDFLSDNARDTSSGRFSVPNPGSSIEYESASSVTSPTVGGQSSSASTGMVTPSNKRIVSKRGSALQIDMTKSFMTKARNFAISINKDFVESVKKKGGYTPFGNGEGASANKQRAAIIPVMAPEEKIDTKRYKKTKQQNEMLLSVVSKEFAGFLGGTLLKDIDAQSIVDVMFRVDIPIDTCLVTQGEPSDKMFVIDNGKVGVYTQDFVDRPPEFEVEKTSGEAFGVLSLIYNQPAPFMVKTHTNCQLWALPSRKFHELSTSETKRRLARKIRLLHGVPLIADNLEGDAVASLADSMEFKEYHKGDVVLKVGDVVEQVLIVGEGSAKLVSSTTDKQMAEANMLEAGDVFGEWALLGKNMKSDYTIIAESATLTVLILETTDVEELVGPLREFVLEKMRLQELAEQHEEATQQTKTGPSGVITTTQAPPLPPRANSLKLAAGVGGVSDIQQITGTARKGTLIKMALPTASSTVSIIGGDDPNAISPTSGLTNRMLGSSAGGPGGKRSVLFRSAGDPIDRDLLSMPPQVPPSRTPPPPLPPPSRPVDVAKSSVLFRGNLGLNSAASDAQQEEEIIAAVAEEVKRNEEHHRKTRAEVKKKKSGVGSQIFSSNRPGTSTTRSPSPSSPRPLTPPNGVSSFVPVETPPPNGPEHLGATAEDGDENEIEGENLDKPFQKPTAHLRPEMDTGSLKFVALLGSGNFGRVHLVQNEKAPEELFALKVLTRHYIVLNGWEKMVENERDAMLELSGFVASPFVLKLFNSFSDSKNVYLLLELCEGGDLYALMRATKAQRFSEESVKFYFACVVMGLEAMQTRDIVYRDLKPENLMIDSKGYIKVADFGLAKKTLRTFTVCGTPEYMAPETILSKGHNIAADWWAAGVLMFEFLNGCTPFTSGGESMEVYEKILAHAEVDDLLFPDDVEFSPQCKDLIKQLMHPKKNKRIGVKYPGIDAVKLHDFFTDFNWLDLAALKMPPPIVPHMTHIQKMLDDSVTGKKYDPRLLAAPDDHSGWTLSF